MNSMNISFRKFIAQDLRISFEKLKKVYCIYGLRLFLSLSLICASFLYTSSRSYAKNDTLDQDIYTDALSPGWQDWSWAGTDLQATEYVHSGSYSIAVNANAWGGMQLHYPGFPTNGFTSLHFFINGGSAGAQHLNLYATYSAGGDDQQSTVISLPPLIANTWSEISISFTDLGIADVYITELVWQNATANTLPTYYLDDIALVSDEDPNGPGLSSPFLNPRAVPADGMTEAVVRLQVTDPQGPSDIASVTLDGAALGRGPIELYDDGLSNDGAANDGIFGGVFTVAPGTSSGEVTLVVTAKDQANHTSSLPIGAFDILASQGGMIPESLPTTLGWGSNAWSETPGDDWQQNSGVPWNYDYQYITYDWYVNGWGGDFVTRFVNQAWSKNYVPLISVYLILGLPPTCGESGACYATKLQDPNAVNIYLSAIQEAARQAQGTDPVIFQLEPDFYGYMQQLSNRDDRPPGVQPDDPGSFPVALNISGYPNNLAGFGRRVVDVIHATAPNALVAPHASMWATNVDPFSVVPSEVINIAERTAAFIDAMGGAQSDLLVVEWSDRDAGSGLRPWWDDTNQWLPRPTRAILWENALSAASNKRLILWQMPVGNMALDNTCDHYQDNKAAYLFQHPRDLYDAGVFAILFGGGADCSTQVWSDGGFVAAQGAIAYAIPSAPTGLAAAVPIGPVVLVHWDENSEPDVFGYRLDFQSMQGGPHYIIDARRENSTNLILPWQGDWRITVAAYDAMNQLGLDSDPVFVHTTVDPLVVFLPLVKR